MVQERKGDGNPCVGQKTDVRPCHDEGCPEDCAWRDWTVWTPCTVTCGPGGVSERIRGLVPAVLGGRPCDGPDTQTKECHNHSCPINCTWDDWAPWSNCTLSCGAGTRKRNRVQLASASFGGKECIGGPNDTEVCNELQCPVDCKWGPWTAWSLCSEKCGSDNGLKNRTRKKDGPLNGGLDCNGIGYELTPCNVGKQCSVNCSWEDWNEWTACDRTCDTGQKTRYRFVYEEAQGPEGHNCSGDHSEKADCVKMTVCPHDCRWEHWQDWDACSRRTCGPAQRMRIRGRDQARDGGAQCEGNSTENEECVIAGAIVTPCRDENTTMPPPCDPVQMTTLTTTMCRGELSHEHMKCTNDTSDDEWLLDCGKLLTGLKTRNWTADSGAMMQKDLVIKLPGLHKIAQLDTFYWVGNICKFKVQYFDAETSEWSDYCAVQASATASQSCNLGDDNFVVTNQIRLHKVKDTICAPSPNPDNYFRVTGMTIYGCKLNTGGVATAPADNINTASGADNADNASFDRRIRVPAENESDAADPTVTQEPTVDEPGATGTLSQHLFDTGPSETTSSSPQSVVQNGSEFGDSSEGNSLASDSSQSSSSSTTTSSSTSSSTTTSSSGVSLEEQAVVGRYTMSVSDPDVFTRNSDAQNALRESIAEQANVASESVTIYSVQAVASAALLQNSGRNLGSSRRKLSDALLAISYEVAPSQTRSSSDIAGALGNSEEADSMARNLNTKLENVGLHVTTSVVGTVAAEKKGTTTTVPNVNNVVRAVAGEQPTPSPSPAGSSDPANDRSHAVLRRASSFLIVVSWLLVPA